jgi:hypothetical protein
MRIGAVAEKSGSAAERFGFVKGLLCAAVFLFLILSFLPVRYEANDDFGLIARFSPRSGFATDPLQPLVSWTLGSILCFLYARLPGVPWYGLFIYGSALCGMALMLGVLFRSARGASLLLALPLLGTLFFHVFAFAGFTSAALLLECGVLLCVLEWAVRGECPARNPRWYAGALALGFLVAFLLRWRMVLYAASLGAPILLFLRRGWLRGAIPFVAAVGLVVAGDRALFHSSSSEEYKAYVEYSRLRARFHDTVQGGYHGETTETALQKAGWSREDYVFYKSWILYDNQRFNARSLRAFLAANDPGKAGSLLGMGLEGLRRQFRMGHHYALALVFGTLSVLVYRLEHLSSLSRGRGLKICLALAFVASGILYIMCFRFVPRLFVPLSAYFFGLCFLFFHEKGGEGRALSRGGPARRRVLPAVGLALSLLTWGQAHAQGRMAVALLKGSEAEKASMHKALSGVKGAGSVSDPLLVVMNPVSGLGAEYVHPLREFSDYTDLRVFPAGWGVHSPRFVSTLREMGLADGHAFLAWLIDNPQALLVLRTSGAEDTWRWKSLWESYLARRIAPDRGVRLVPAHDFRDARGAGLVVFLLKFGS